MCPVLDVFLGVFNQVRNYLGHDYAVVVEPLTALTRGKKPVFKWEEKHQLAFEIIRDRLLAGVHLHAPDYSVPFHYYSDASDDGKGGVLCQFPPGCTPSKHFPPDQSKARVISYFSQAWKDAELIWKACLSCGAFASVASTLSLLHFHYIPTQIIYPCDGWTKAKRAQSVHS